MSKGFNKILDFMKLNDDEYEEYDDEEIDTEEEPEEAPKKKTFARSTANSRKTSARQKDELEDMADDWDDEPEVKSTRSTQAHTSSRSTRKATPYGRSSKIVPMHSNITSRSMEVCVSKPDEFDTCQEICDIILSGRAAIINFDAVTTQEAQRIIDFVSGSCYASYGNIKPISDTIVIVTPEDIDITGDLQELASSSVNVPAFGYSEEEE